MTVGGSLSVEGALWKSCQSSLGLRQAHNHLPRHFLGAGAEPLNSHINPMPLKMWQTSGSIALQS